MTPIELFAEKVLDSLSRASILALRVLLLALVVMICLKIFMFVANWFEKKYPTKTEDLIRGKD